MTLAGLLLGLINIAIVVVVLLLIGVLAQWLLSWLGVSLPAMAVKLYIAVVALIAFYMLVSILLGMPVPFHVIR